MDVKNHTGGNTKFILLNMIRPTNHFHFHSLRSITIYRWHTVRTTVETTRRRNILDVKSIALRRDGLVDSVSASHAVGPVLASRPSHNKDHHKHGTNCPPACHAVIKVDL